MSDSFSFEADLAALEVAGLNRSLREVRHLEHGRSLVDGHQALNLCSNDYLGLSQHPALKAAAIEAIETYGTGSCASRLIAGSTVLHNQLEQSLAEFSKTESSLLFGTGYQANVGVVSALADSSTVVYSDELNHASIIDGCRLSKAKTVVFKHADVEHLNHLKGQHKGQKSIVVTDSVFSMDGDAAPLEALVSSCQTSGALLLVDEAHAVGVVGNEGRGLVDKLGLNELVDVKIGTLGKSFGSSGAYAACSHTIRQILINRARSFVFSTAAAPATLAAALKAVEIVKNGELTAKLQTNIELIRELFQVQSTDLLTPIVPLLVPGNHNVMSVTQELLQQSIYVQGIRSPTVAAGSERLRVTVSAVHSQDDLRSAAEKISSTVNKHSSTLASL